MKKTFIHSRSIFLLAVFLILISVGCQVKRQILAIGDKAPDFILSDLSGNKVSLTGSLKGKEILLNFWASWCSECRQEMPQLDKFSKSYSHKIEIIGINIRESKEQVVSFVNAEGISYKILLDGRGKAAELYGIVGVPTNVLINKDGLIKNRNLDVRQMESYLRQNN